MEKGQLTEEEIADLEAEMIMEKAQEVLRASEETLREGGFK